MTDKELQKLGRRELLQLLLDQAKETEQLRAGLAAAGERAQEMEDTFERLPRSATCRRPMTGCGTG